MTIFKICQTYAKIYDKYMPRAWAELGPRALGSLCASNFEYFGVSGELWEPFGRRNCSTSAFRSSLDGLRIDFGFNWESLWHIMEILGLFWRYNNPPIRG